MGELKLNSIRLMLTFKRELFLEGLTRLLTEKSPNFDVVAKCSNGADCIKKARELEPDLILLDTEITDFNCVEVIKQITTVLPKSRILILTLSEQQSDLLATINAGASAYISKDTSIEALINDIERVQAGELVVSRPMAEKLLGEFRLLEEEKNAKKEGSDFGLSKRENEVLKWVERGSTNREIADGLFISENTVKVHLSNILEKLHVRNRQQAAVMRLTGKDSKSE